MSEICVVGSLNMDTTMSVEKLPETGETIEGKNISYSAGGKGFNQAVTARRLGSKVSFVGALGQDENGAFLRQIIKQEKIGEQHIASVDVPTGIAWVLIDGSGKNMILTYGGANTMLTAKMVQTARRQIETSNVVVSQFEVPEETVIAAFEIARQTGATTILNPAPGKVCSDRLLELTDYLIPNETEFDLLVGKQSADDAERTWHAQSLLEKVRRAVIITQGEAGALIVTRNGTQHVEAVKTKAVDTTAAGDSFIGTVAHCLACMQPIDQAVKKGAQVAARVVSQFGAYTSIPSAEELADQ
ncbi:ribokinase [Listeria ilorinensis]|uniref:ribokinase n=1 Tax=Listeria ilorinensis TaxID=2867439 RepID=UPI001EF66B1D|nr:ribokinase [Listeria ilorinensis]